MNDRTIMTRIDLVAQRTRTEEQRQNKKWGEQNHPDGTGQFGDAEIAHDVRAATQANFAAGVGTWRDVLEEEVAEAFAESDPEKLKEELTQVAAVAQQWVRAIERKQKAEDDEYGDWPNPIPPEEYMPADLDDELDMRL